MNACERGYEKFRRMRGRSKAAADRDWMKYADDAARLLYEEIDYVNEGQNAETFAASLEGTGANVVVPKVFKEVLRRETRIARGSSPLASALTACASHFCSGDHREGVDNGVH